MLGLIQKRYNKDEKALKDDNLFLKDVAQILPIILQDVYKVDKYHFNNQTSLVAFPSEMQVLSGPSKVPFQSETCQFGKPNFHGKSVRICRYPNVAVLGDTTKTVCGGSIFSRFDRLS